MLLLGGIAIFMFGLKQISDNVQALAGKKMKGLLSTVTGSRLKGVIAGASVTGVLQSSTATNIMLVGFVNAGVLTVGQAIPVVMGANIGTTVTAQLVSLSGSNLFNVTALGSLVAFIGFVLGFFKGEKTKCIGAVAFGFGLIFIGLEIMNNAIFAFRGYAFFKRLFMAKNPLILILNGLLITGIVQSSSAVSSVMIILAVNGLITFESSAYLILGANIGAGLAVLLVSATLTENARKVAVANIVFNVVGALVCLIPLVIFEGEIAKFFALISGGVERQIANFHTIFNLVVTIVLLPFVGLFEKIVDYLTPRKFQSRQKKKSMYAR